MITVAVVYTIMGTLGAIGAVRGIVLDVKNYSVFPNLP